MNTDERASSLYNLLMPCDKQIMQCKLSGSWLQKWTSAWVISSRILYVISSTNCHFLAHSPSISNFWSHIQLETGHDGDGFFFITPRTYGRSAIAYVTSHVYRFYMDSNPVLTVCNTLPYPLHCPNLPERERERERENVYVCLHLLPPPTTDWRPSTDNLSGRQPPITDDVYDYSPP